MQANTNLPLGTEIIMNGFIAKARTGKIFTVTFIKKDGTIRSMNARIGVTKGVTGNGLRWNPKSRGMLPVFDMQKNAFRIINFKTILSIQMEGKSVYLMNPQVHTA